MTILWWHWLVLGLVLALAELAAAGGFYIIFFGFGALVVGVLAAMGLEELWVQLALFGLISIGSLVLFRSRLLQWLQVNPQMSANVDQLIGEMAVASEDLAPGAMGKVELRGAAWSARNTGAATIVRGTRCRVVRIDGLTVEVVLEGDRS